jgi:hypothetical protein
MVPGTLRFEQHVCMNVSVGNITTCTCHAGTASHADTNPEQQYKETLILYHIPFVVVDSKCCSPIYFRTGYGLKICN